jgi:hypothetical protein
VLSIAFAVTARVTRALRLLSIRSLIPNGEQSVGANSPGPSHRAFRFAACSKLRRPGLSLNLAFALADVSGTLFLLREDGPPFRSASWKLYVLSFRPSPGLSAIKATLGCNMGCNLGCICSCYRLLRMGLRRFLV